MKVYRAESLQDTDYDQLVVLLQAGGVIAFPTDTAYGLGADPFSAAGVNRIFDIKGRPETKPILLIVNSVPMAASVSVPGTSFAEVAQEFWPGPLTLVVPSPFLPKSVTSGTGTIGLRWPVSVFATCLVQRLGKPITATSANRSGMPSTVTPEEVRTQLGESIDALVDGGELPCRTGSTLLDLTVEPPVLLREGPISFERLHEFFKGKIRRRVA